MEPVAFEVLHWTTQVTRQGAFLRVCEPFNWRYSMSAHLSIEIGLKLQSSALKHFIAVDYIQHLGRLSIKGCQLCTAGTIQYDGI
jgi:hypothetical protein